MEKTFETYLEEQQEYNEGIREILSRIKEEIKDLPQSALKDLALVIDDRLTDSKDNAFGDRK